MKNLLILFTMAILIFSCAMPENTESSDDNTTSTVLANVVLYDGVMNDTTNLLFQKATYEFTNSVIQVKFEFSDPEVFDGTHTIKTNTTTAAHTISIFAPTFSYIENIDLTTNLYFRVESLNWLADPGYDGRNVDLKITWIRE